MNFVIYCRSMWIARVLLGVLCIVCLVSCCYAAHIPEPVISTEPSLRKSGSAWRSFIEKFMTTGQAAERQNDTAWTWRFFSYSDNGNMSSAAIGKDRNFSTVEGLKNSTTQISPITEQIKESPSYKNNNTEFVSVANFTKSSADHFSLRGRHRGASQTTTMKFTSQAAASVPVRLQLISVKDPALNRLPNTARPEVNRKAGVKAERSAKLINTSYSPNNTTIPSYTNAYTIYEDLNTTAYTAANPMTIVSSTIPPSKVSLSKRDNTNDISTANITTDASVSYTFSTTQRSTLSTTPVTQSSGNNGKHLYHETITPHLNKSKTPF